MKKSIHILYIGGSHSIGGDHNPRKLSFLLEVEAPRFLVVLGGLLREVLGGLLREVRAGLLREVQGGMSDPDRTQNCCSCIKDELNYF